MSNVVEQAERISRLGIRTAHNMRIGETAQSVLASLTTSQLQILSIIEECGTTEVSMGELARELAVTMPSVTGLIDQLVKSSLVSRRHDDRDRRRVLVSLTEEGRRALADVWEAIVEMVARLLEGMPEAERQSLVVAAERMHALSLEIRDEETAAHEARGRRSA